MLRLVIRAAGLALLLSSCTSASVRQYEGFSCSTNSSDDPQFVCTPAQDLVCIATYNKLVTNVEEAKKFDGGLRPVYLCRMACNVTADCPQIGDVCCKGPIHGKSYGKVGGCVPPSTCEGESTSEEDAGVAPDARQDTRPADAPRGDAPAPLTDGPAVPDAGLPDAPSADGSAPVTDGPAVPDDAGLPDAPSTDTPTPVADAGAGAG